MTKPPKFLASIKCFFIFLFFLAFSQMTLDLHIRNRMKLRSKFCFLQNEIFLAKRVPTVSYMVFLICGMLLYIQGLQECTNISHR